MKINKTVLSLGGFLLLGAPCGITAAIQKITVTPQSGQPYHLVTLVSETTGENPLLLPVPTSEGTSDIAYLVPEQDIAFLLERDHVKKTSTWKAHPCGQWCTNPLSIGWCVQVTEYVETPGQHSSMTYQEQDDPTTCAAVLNVAINDVDAVPNNVLGIALEESPDLRDAIETIQEEMSP